MSVTRPLGRLLAAAALIALVGCVEQAPPSPDAPEPAAPADGPMEPAPTPAEPAPTPAEPEPAEPAPEPEPAEPAPAEPGCLPADGCDPAGVQYLKAHDAAPWDRLGYALAVDGDRMAVGAPGAQFGARDAPAGGGVVYIFERDAAGAWLEVDRLASVGTEQYDDFGASVALAGDLLAVGAPSEADLMPPDSLVPAGAAHTVGAVHLFELHDGRWREVAWLQAQRPDHEVYFGVSLAFDGRRLVVGAPRDSVGGDAPADWRPVGVAYVFERGADGAWRQAARLVADDPQRDADFGRSVALDGDRVIVGAPLEGERGAVYVFEAGGPGWSRAARLTPADWRGEGRFGGTLAAGDGRFVVGVARRPMGASVISRSLHFGRAVFVYEAVDAEPAVLTGPEWSGFGAGLALHGSQLLVGAPISADDPRDAGAALLFVRDAAGGWSQAARLTAPNRAAHGVFGWAVAFDRGRPVIGAWGDAGGPRSTLTAPDASAASAGAVYVFGDVGPR